MFKKTKICSAVLLAVGGTTGLVSAPVLAQQQLEKVEITGSAIKRIDAETALPVTVMTREEITRSGATNMEQLVQRISASSSAGNTTGSQTAGLSTYSLSSISLRGLEEQRTLVLLNGRRLAVFAGGNSGGAIDINAIPISAIERIEVLRDGASALYGSDAVAGVVNFILRKDFAGLEVMVNSGAPTKSGGGKVDRANILFGAGDPSKDGYNFMVGIDLEKSSSLFAKERDFSRSGNRAPYFQNAATPSGRIEGVWDPAKFTLDPITKTFVDSNGRDAKNNPFGISTSGYGNPFAPDRCADINMFTVNAPGGVDGKYRNCNFDSAPFVGLFPKVERASLVASGRIDLSPEAQLYGEVLYSKTKSTEAYQPSPVRYGFLYPGDLAFTDPAQNPNKVAPVLLIYPNNPAYQTILRPYLLANGLAAMDGKPIAVTLRTFLTGPRTEVDTNEQGRVVAGLRGTVSNWDYDVAAAFNEAKTSGQVTDGYFSQLGLATVLNDPASNWNPWAIGGNQDPALTQKLQSSKYVGPTLSGLSRAVSVDGTATTSIGELSGGAMQLAVGSAVRRERYKIDVPAILGSGDIAGLGGATAPLDESRTVAALFSELNMPVTKQLEVNASARFDRYSDVGSTTNGKLSTRWTPTPQVLLRAAVGTGFRAPTLYELHQPQVIGVTEQFIDPQHAGDGLIQANAINGGNPDLKPEKSKQLSLGIVVSPVKNFTAGLDIFAINIKNYITTPAALALVNGVRAGTPLYGPNDATFAADGTVDTVDQTNRNAASALVKGIDINLNWSDKFDFGKLTADLSGTYISTFDLKTLAGVQHSVGTIIQPDGSPLDIADLGVISRWKHTLSFNWSVGSWSTTIFQNYYSGYQDANDLNGDPHRVPSVALYDAQVEFTGVKNLTVALGVKNLFDKQPPLFIGNGSSFQYGYDPQNFDPRGRFAYFTLKYKFF